MVIYIYCLDNYCYPRVWSVVGNVVKAVSVVDRSGKGGHKAARNQGFSDKWYLGRSP